MRKEKSSNLMQILKNKCMGNNKKGVKIIKNFYSKYG